MKMADAKSLTDRLMGYYDNVRSTLRNNGVAGAICAADNGCNDCHSTYYKLKDTRDAIKKDYDFGLADSKGKITDGLLKISGLLDKLSNLRSFYHKLSDCLPPIKHPIDDVDVKNAKISKLDSVLVYNSALILTPGDLLKIIPVKIDPFNDPASINFVNDFAVFYTDRHVNGIIADYNNRLGRLDRLYKNDYVRRPRC